jgi:hypothetical protein
MTSQTQSNIQGTLLPFLLFCPVSEVAPSRAENNTQLGSTFFITSMYLGPQHNLARFPAQGVQFNVQLIFTDM